MLRLRFFLTVDILVKWQSRYIGQCITTGSRGGGCSQREVWSTCSRVFLLCGVQHVHVVLCVLLYEMLFQFMYQISGVFIPYIKCQLSTTAEIEVFLHMNKTILWDKNLLSYIKENVRYLNIYFLKKGKKTNIKNQYIQVFFSQTINLNKNTVKWGQLHNYPTRVRYEVHQSNSGRHTKDSLGIALRNWKLAFWCAAFITPLLFSMGYSCACIA